MSRHRFFLTGPLPHAEPRADVAVPLSVDDAHHALRVLRLGTGEEIDVVEPGGAIWRVRVTVAQPGEPLHVEILEPLPATVEPDVTLVFGVLKGGKNEDVIEGAVEVGVLALLPVLTSRCIVKLDAEKCAERGERWRRVATAAAKQSKRSRVPVVNDPAALSEVMETLGAFDLLLVAWEDAVGSGMADRVHAAGLAPGARVAVVVGPEGGLSEQEITALEAFGALTCTLGPTILRAQTAAVVAGALAVHELGGLGGAGR